MRIVALGIGLCVGLCEASAHGISENDKLQFAPAESDASIALPVALPADAIGPARAVVDTLKVWEPGAQIKICFLAGSAKVRSRIAYIASTWTKFANLTFDFGSPEAPRDCRGDGTENIKIGFMASGAWSYVGTDSHKHSPSMNLQDLDAEPAIVHDNEFVRLVLHEFGHALGLQHEHQSPEAKCGDEIDWPAAIAYFRQCCGWQERDVRHNIQTLTKTPRLRTTAYNKTSIMHYTFPAVIFREGKASKCFAPATYELSQTDRFAISQVYPDTKQKQDQHKANSLAALDGLMKDAGVSDQDRKKAIEDIAARYSASQTITSGRDTSIGVNVQGGVNMNTNSGGIAIIGGGAVTVEQPKK